MKVRTGFVSNSSATSFVIKNTTDKDLTLKDFIIENKHLIDEFNKEYGGHGHEGYTLKQLLASVKEYKYKFPAKSSTTCIFGDEHGNPIGDVYDYILRDGGTSKSFSWRFDEFLR